MGGRLKTYASKFLINSAKNLSIHQLFMLPNCIWRKGSEETDYEREIWEHRTMIPILQNNAAAGYQGRVKIELLKGAGLLQCYKGGNLIHHENVPQNLYFSNREEETKQAHPSIWFLET